MAFLPSIFALFNLADLVDAGFPFSANNFNGWWTYSVVEFIKEKSQLVTAVLKLAGI
jgi:hypothetical protein